MPKRTRKQPEKQKQKKVRGQAYRSTPSLIPLKKVIEDHFVLKNGEIMDIYRINTYDYDSLSEDDKNYMLTLWERFYQAYGNDIKIISLNFATDTRRQQKYFQAKEQKNHNGVYAPFLQETLAKLGEIAKHNVDRYFYFMTFSADEDEYEQSRNIIYGRLIGTSLAKSITLSEKISVLAKLGNKNSATSLESRYYINSVEQEKQQKETEKRGYNPYLLADIQPQGNISFNSEKYIKTGSGYESCITVYRYPSLIGLYWLISVLGINHSVAILDINTQDPYVTKRNLNSSIKEETKRLESENELTSKDRAAVRIEELRQYYQEIDRQGQVNKMITLRLFLFARTWYDIDQITGSVLEKLHSDGFEAAVFYNESKLDWISQFQSYTTQQKSDHARIGQPILSRALAKGLPFYFTNIDDPSGSPLGTTNSNNGIVLLDMFTKTDTRLSYNALIIGTMGAGKSTSLKKFLIDNAIRGNFLRIFDPNGEYQRLVEQLGGYNLSLDDAGGKLNALEILKTTDEGEALCWVNHLSKLSTCYSLIAPNADVNEKAELEMQMADFYSSYGLIDFNKDLNSQNLTGLSPTEYPTWSDFYRYLKSVATSLTDADSVVQQERVLQQSKRLDSILLHIKNLIQNYGYFVDGHTSIAQILDMPIVSFNMGNLTNISSEIADMQTFLVLQLCLDNCLQVGIPMKRLYDEGQIEWDDITRSVIVIDECHRYLNAQKLPLTKQVIRFQREARKHFGGLWLATHNIRDFVPEGSTQEGIDEMKVLFELCEYKFLMRQDMNSKDQLGQVFGKILSSYDIEKIPTLGQGDAILCIGSERKVQMHIDLTERENQLFTGGA